MDVKQQRLKRSELLISLIRLICLWAASQKLERLQRMDEVWFSGMKRTLEPKRLLHSPSSPQKFKTCGLGRLLETRTDPRRLLVRFLGFIESVVLKNRKELWLWYRVNWPITDHMPMTEHLFISSSYVLHFEWFKMLWECYLKLWKSSLNYKWKGVMKK